MTKTNTQNGVDVLMLHCLPLHIHPRQRDPYQLFNTKLYFKPTIAFILIIVTKFYIKMM